MKFKIKDMDIHTGGALIGLMNKKDAFMFDFHALDRLAIKRGKNQTVLVLDITTNDKLIPPGHLGLYEETLKELKAKDKDIIDVSLSVKPHSVQYIRKKLDGESLRPNEIDELLRDISARRISDIELTYYVASNYTHGMSLTEVVALTKAMIKTGDIISIKEKPIIDKHCIGGIAGNRTTMIIVPILLACGLKVPKTSSRSITSPAGTADTMEVLCNVTMGMKGIKNMLKKIGGFMIWGGSVNLAPADDTIINVEHPLSIDAKGQLLASIMAKKGSVSATHVLIDIPVGKNAKIKDRKKANELKRDFEVLGKYIGIKTKVIITSGIEPIGNGIGPALEARDALWILKNDSRGSEELKRKSLKMAGLMLEMGKYVKKGMGHTVAKDILESGMAYRKMVEIIKMQGPNPEGKIITEPEKIQLGKYSYTLRSSKRGRVREVNNNTIARIARMSGCPIDKAAGVYLYVHSGDRVKKRDKLYTIYSVNKQKFEFVKKYARKDSGIVVR